MGLPEMTEQPATQNDNDALIGLRFEVGGGLSRMTGRVLGKTGGLYLVQKTDCDYCELLQLDDLRSAKFYWDAPETAAAKPADSAVTTPADPAPPISAESGDKDPEAAASPGRRRLADQLRRHLGRQEPN
jgi:hypothetical protein